MNTPHIHDGRRLQTAQAEAGNARDAIHSSPVDRCLLQVDDLRSIECGNRW